MRQWHGAQVPHAHSSSAGFRLLAQLAKAARGRQVGKAGSAASAGHTFPPPRLASPPSSAFTARRRSSGLARIGAAAVCCMCMDVHVCMDLHAGKKSVCTIPCLHEKCASAAIAIPVFFAHHSPILSLLTQASLTPSGRSHSRLTAGSLAYLHPSPRCFTRLLTLRFAKQSLSTTSLHRTHLHTSAPEDNDVPRTVAVSCGAG